MKISEEINEGTMMNLRLDVGTELNRINKEIIERIMMNLRLEAGTDGKDQENLITSDEDQDPTDEQISSKNIISSIEDQKNMPT